MGGGDALFGRDPDRTRRHQGHERSGGASARLYGRLPDAAVTASIELSDGTVATVQAASDGYFLLPITMAPDPNIDVVGITAFASDGTVIATSPSP